METYNMILATGNADAPEVKDGSRAPEKVYEKMDLSDMKELLENGCTGSFEETLEEIATQTSAAKGNPYAGLEGMPIMHTLTRSMPIWLLQSTLDRMEREIAVYAGKESD